MKSVDKDRFINYYIKYCGYSKSAKKKQIIGNFYDELINCEVAKDNKIIVFALPTLDSNLLDSFLVNRAALKKRGRIETYAYELSAAQDVLGYSISKACQHYLCDDFKFASAIFYELSYFGYTLKTQNDETNDFLDSINKSIEAIENGTAALISSDEVFKDLGYIDSRTEAEKKFDKIEAKLHCKFINNLKKELYKLELSY